MSEAVRGSCLCGDVRFEVRMPAAWFQCCHCSRCRKKTGSAAPWYRSVPDLPGFEEVPPRE